MTDEVRGDWGSGESPRPHRPPHNSTPATQMPAKPITFSGTTRSHCHPRSHYNPHLSLGAILLTLASSNPPLIHGDLFSPRHSPITGFLPILRSHRPSSRMSNKVWGDRFIPNRAGMNISLALLHAPARDKKEESEISPSKKAYRKQLDDVFFEGRTRILSYTNQTPMPTKLSDPLTEVKYVSQRQRYIPKAPEKILDAPDLLDDYQLNLLDWGSANILSIALSDSVYLWNAASGSAHELVDVGPECGPVNSLRWAPDGRQIALGLPSSDVQIWDCNAGKLIRTPRGIHQYAVGALAWNGNMLSTGSLDCTIVNNDIRVRDHAVSSYSGHRLEVCSLKWSESGRQLASGASDGRLNIWDLSKGTQLRRFSHSAMPKAIAWCPYQSNLIASGEGADNGRIKLWDVDAGTCLKSVETGSSCV